MNAFEAMQQKKKEEAAAAEAAKKNNRGGMSKSATPGGEALKRDQDAFKAKLNGVLGKGKPGAKAPAAVGTGGTGESNGDVKFSHRGGV